MITKIEIKFCSNTVISYQFLTAPKININYLLYGKIIRIVMDR